jgi:hypothetical protein
LSEVTYAQAAGQALGKALPFLAKQVPKLWPLLLEAKNREKVSALLRDAAASSPKKKLAAKMEITEMLAQTLVEQASNESERQRAEQWQRRARKLRVRLDMPVEGIKARRAHRAGLHRDLAALHEEMSHALSED